MLLELALKVLAVVALAIVALTAYLYFTQRGQLYFPWPDDAAAHRPASMSSSSGPRTACG